MRQPASDSRRSASQCLSASRRPAIGSLRIDKLNGLRLDAPLTIHADFAMLTELVQSHFHKMAYSRSSITAILLDPP